MEPETPVNQRALRRALAPPLTLLKFFKPRAEKTSDGGEVEESSDRVDVSCPNTLSFSSATGGSPGLQAVHTVCSSSQSKGKIHTTCGSVATATRGCSKQVKLADAFSSTSSPSPQPTSRDRPIVITDDTLRKNVGVCGAKSEGARRRRKRKLEQEVGVAPIKQALDRRASSSVVRCPVCQQEFAEMKNLDLNAHLDVCLQDLPPPVRD